MSLKQLQKIVLQYAVDSKCGGLALADRLMSPKMRRSNPSCDVSHKVGMGGAQLVGGLQEL